MREKERKALKRNRERKNERWKSEKEIEREGEANILSESGVEKGGGRGKRLVKNVTFYHLNTRQTRPRIEIVPLNEKGPIVGVTDT